MVAVNTPKKHAELMADLLATADYRGHFSHGMNRIALYVDDIQTGGVIAAATPTILNVNTCNYNEIYQLIRALEIYILHQITMS